MAAQAALIADTIVDSGPDNPITEPTNRGNKLRANAQYVREGALGYIHSEDLYKQKIEHAGYTRYILQQNPVRYDSEGDELDEDDEDSAADAIAAEENPFSEIALEKVVPKQSQPDQNGEPQAADKDVEMTDAQNQETQGDAPKDNVEQGKVPKAEEVDTPVGDLPQHPETTVPGPLPNGNSTGNSQSWQVLATDSDTTLDKARRENANDKPATSVEGALADPGSWADTQGNETDQDEEMHDEADHGPPQRMTTRAQVNAVNPQQELDPSNLSPSPSSDTLSTLPAPHPLFLTPNSVRPDPNFGLPPNEAEDTRRLLWSYVQKQEETVRGFEHMLECLLRAGRMKEDVLEWCKAEGHVGEMSDGEDWYDREKWGLAEGEDLKKGADEDEIETVEESRTSNKRGRGRRA
ncbi:hypothetical protein N8T08_000219 [Aspergillus melleus]|uniref:Uncharacterized protein n=1 Tax=Aspergillus melleus TaxID=138277 RepID=A0ACC3BHI9_9EURO|nr:hypothetical protein N8T08_000219 [Aspergillus melleus]